MMEGLIYDIMVDVDERPEGWNKELYDKLSFEYLIECATKYDGIREWNKEYEKYLKSEWNRLYPGVEYNPENKGKLCFYRYGFVRPDYSKKDFKKAITDGANFSGVHLEGVEIIETDLEGAHFYRGYLDGAQWLGSHLKGASFTSANLENACFHDAHLEKANFENGKLQKADFSDAHLEGAYFRNTHLESAQLSGSHLEGADFSKTNLEGAIFYFAIVNGETLFTKNAIDDKTNFTGTSLSSTRIDPALRTKLERNIRQIRWERWYVQPKFYPFIGMVINSFWVLCCRILHLFKDQPKVKYESKNYHLFNESILYHKLRIFWYWPTKPFIKINNASNQNLDEIGSENISWDTKCHWVDQIVNNFVRFAWWISDYGSSTIRIIVVFFGWNILWACIYFYVMPFISGLFSAGTTTTVLNVSNIGAAILQTNLMMFSITDLATEGLDILPMLFVTIHIVGGYFILVTLITRLGIIFQGLSP